MTKCCTALLAIFSVAFLASCNRGNADQAKAKTDEPPSVAVARATVSNLSKTIVLTGEFTPFQEIDVLAKVAGYIKRINVDIGDRVRAGQLLATLEVPELQEDVTKAKAGVERSLAQVKQAQDQVESARSSKNMMNLTYTRLAGVAQQQKGLVAQQEIDDAHAKELNAEAQLAAAQSNLAAAQQQVDVNRAEVSKMQTMLDYTQVTAPFAGVITKRYANTGSMIQAGTASQSQAMPVVRLAENTLLRLSLPVPESAVPTVHVGQKLDVKVPTLKRTFPGKVARFAEQLQLATRTMDTEVDVQNPTLVLVPGMYAEVDLTLNQQTGVVTVPITALELSGKTGTVLVVNGQNQIERRTVSIGLETANRVEVLSGIHDGERVVISGRESLHPGEKVTPKLTHMGSEEGDS